MFINAAALVWMKTKPQYSHALDDKDRYISYLYLQQTPWDLSCSDLRKLYSVAKQKDQIRGFVHKL